MIIERANINDLAGLIVESKDMFAQMGFESGGMAWEYESMIEWWSEVISAPDHDTLVARENGRIVGVSVIMYLDTFRWHKGQLQAWELAHHASPDLTPFVRCRIMIRLLKEQMKNIKSRGAKFFRISYSPFFPAWGKYLQDNGYSPTSHCLAIKI